GVSHALRRHIARQAAASGRSDWQVYLSGVPADAAPVADLIVNADSRSTDRGWIAALSEAMARLTGRQYIWSSVSLSYLWPKDGTLHDWVWNVQLRRSDRGEDYQQSDAVTLLTAHAAKGLEWPAVIVADAMDGVFPSARSLREGGDAGEER